MAALAREPGGQPAAAAADLARSSRAAGPGGWLNVFGWYVIGSVAGSGNAIVVRADDPAVYYAGHEWYSDDEVDFEDFGGAGKGKWVSVPFTADGVRRALGVSAVYSLNLNQQDAIDRNLNRAPRFTLDDENSLMDAILTGRRSADDAAAERFLTELDSAIVMRNASTSRCSRWKSASFWRRRS